MNWKLLRAAVAGLLMVAAVGCGGFNGSHAISPASFLIPGLGQVQPASTNAPVHVAVVE